MQKEYFPSQSPAQAPEAKASVLPPSIEKQLEADLSKDKVTLKKMWTGMGDIVRDLDTANTMAKEKFDGDTALMHVARGAVTTGVGVGLDRAMDYVWDSVWSGDIPFYDKSKFNPKMAEEMNTFALSSDKKARLTYWIKESTQDISSAVFYNFLAFRGQPLFPKVEAKHLVRSLGIDAAEAFLAPTVPADMKDRAHASQAKIADSKIDKLKQSISNDLRSSYKNSEEKIDGKGYDINVTYEFDSDIRANKDLLESARNEKIFHEAADKQYDPKQHATEHLIRQIINVSNPVTHLGTEWMIAGGKTFIENFMAVRKARGEKGGLAGKKVFMPKEDHGRRDDRKPWQGDRKPWEDRRTPYERKPDHRSDRVYYGKGRSDEKKLEEYELKGS